MAEFDNEEANRLKRWWDDNGTAMVIGVSIGLLVVIGWQGWQWYQDRQAAAAAELYPQVEQAIANDQIDNTAVGLVDRLKSDYAGTPYAANAALRLAAYYVERDDYAKAREQLNWVMNNAANEGVAHIARVRAARLAWTQGQPDEALRLLDAAHPPSFVPLYAEVAGDIHAAQGDREAAHAAYQRALSSLPPGMPRRELESKLAYTAPAEPDTDVDNEANTPNANENASAS